MTEQDPFPPGRWDHPVAGAVRRGESRRRRWRTPLASPVRFVAAALLAVLAGAHLLVLEDQFTRGWYLGAMYLVVVAAAAGLAALLSRHDDRRTWLGTGAFAELAVVVFVVAHVVGGTGGAGIADDASRWTAPLNVLVVVLELAALALAGWTLSRPDRTRPASTRLPLIAGVMALQVGAVAVLVTAPANGAAGSASTWSAGYWAAVAGTSSSTPAGVTRTYFVAADEVAWNYAPVGRNVGTGARFDETANIFVRSGPSRIGSTYLKCRYRGYADETFSAPVARPPDDAYLGLLGPVIRAAVGDTIRIVYRNNCRFPTSMHPHGVFYAKDSEGAPYADGTSGADARDDAVPAGGTHTYTWKVPGRAGPGPHDGSSVMWMYHSHTDEVADTYAGLTGPIVVTAAARSRADGTPEDVDRELFVLYAVMDENSSPYLGTNLRRYAQRPYPDPEDEEFEESNLMHGINGYVYGNQPMMTIRKGERVRWYVMGMGTEVDLHTPHWHGNDVIAHGMRMDVVDLLPASMVIADMVPDNAGVWLFHCHVNDHLSAGMVTRYAVRS